MKLETAQSFSSPNATPADIRTAIADDAQRGEFLILSKSDSCFIQAAGDEEPFFVEYYNDDPQKPRAYQCQSHLTRSQLERVLLKYLAQDEDWEVGYEWVLEEERPWWKFW